MRKLLGLFLVLLLLSAPCFSAVKGAASSPKDMVKVNADAIVPKGATVQNVTALGGRVNIAGTVQEDALAIGGNMQLQKTAIIGGDAVCIGGKMIKEQGAAVGGKIVEITPDQLPAAVSLALDKNVLNNLTWVALIAQALNLLALLVLALLVVALFPGQIGRASYYCERKAGPAFFWGIVGLAMVIPSAILLCISIVGIFFLPLFALLLLAAVFFGYVAFSQLFGKKLLGILKIRNKPMWIEILVGFVILELITLIPIIGWLIKAFATILGIGAVITTRFGVRD